jgi:hypothetical protein
MQKSLLIVIGFLATLSCDRSIRIVVREEPGDVRGQAEVLGTLKVKKTDVSRDDYGAILVATYSLQNITNRKLFVNFRYANRFKEQDSAFFNTAGIVPLPEALTVGDDKFCYENGDDALRQQFYHSQFQYIDRFGNEVDLTDAPVDIRGYCSSLVFLEPGEIFECTENFSYLSFKKDDEYIYPGLYRIAINYCPTKSVGGVDIMPTFLRYDRATSPIVSNQVTIEIKN